MPDISIISHFYNEPQHVLSQIAYWESLPADFLSRVEFILIDDCSTQSPAITATKLDLRLFRITTDIPWNQPGARNLGTFVARGRWALYFDIDQKFYFQPIWTLIDLIGTLDDMTMYFLRSAALKNGSKTILGSIPTTKFPFHYNTFLVNVDKFKLYGMYDEDFSGHYSHDDIYMAEHWERNNGKRCVVTDFVFFEDLAFRTEDLDRDESHNKLLYTQKTSAGIKGPVKQILRFDWEQLQLDGGRPAT